MFPFNHLWYPLYLYVLIRSMGSVQHEKITGFPQHIVIIAVMTVRSRRGETKVGNWLKQPWLPLYLRPRDLRHEQKSTTFSYALFLSTRLSYFDWIFTEFLFEVSNWQHVIVGSGHEWFGVEQATILTWTNGNLSLVHRRSYACLKNSFKTAVSNSVSSCNVQTLMH